MDLDAVAAMASSRDRVRSAQGFNKNVTAYVTKGREALAKVPGGDFTLVHHNAYKANELGECFERNAEVRRGVLFLSRRVDARATPPTRVYAHRACSRTWPSTSSLS